MRFLIATAAGLPSQDVMSVVRQHMTLLHEHRSYDLTKVDANDPDRFEKLVRSWPRSDVALVEVSPVIPGGLKTAAAIKETFPGTEVIVLYRGVFPQLKQLAEAVGAKCQFISSDKSREDLSALAELIGNLRPRAVA